VLSVVGDFSLEKEAALTAELTGWDIDVHELALVGERIINLEKILNQRLGSTREDDDLPDRFTEERVPDAGPTQGMVVEIQRLVSDFYTAMGWDQHGNPSAEKLRELGLEGFHHS
jgi:aldehyde:ferredoxin oxidoreductase